MVFAGDEEQKPHHERKGSQREPCSLSEGLHETGALSTLRRARPGARGTPRAFDLSLRTSARAPRVDEDIELLADEQRNIVSLDAINDLE
jgi:hypothetical protein